MINAYAEQFQMTNRIMCHECEMLLKLNLFQLMEQHRSWVSVLISIYQLDTYDLKNGNVHATKPWKNTCVRVWIQFYATFSLLVQWPVPFSLGATFSVALVRVLIWFVLFTSAPWKTCFEISWSRAELDITHLYHQSCLISPCSWTK